MKVIRVLFWPFTLLDQAMDVFSAHIMKRERERLTNPPLVATVVHLGIVIGAIIATDVEGWTWIIVGAYAGLGANRWLNGALKYRRGYFNGRRDLVNSMAEAHRRGLTPSEWMVSEMERDLLNLGASPEQIEAARRTMQDDDEI